jgi:hypothetical protein
MTHNWLISGLVFVLTSLFMAIFIDIVCFKYVYPTLSMSCVNEIMDERQRSIRNLLRYSKYFSNEQLIEPYLYALHDAYSTDEIHQAIHEMGSTEKIHRVIHELDALFTRQH